MFVQDVKLEPEDVSATDAIYIQDGISSSSVFDWNVESVPVWDVKLEPEDVTQSSSVQLGSCSTDDCKEQLQPLTSRQGGKILHKLCISYEMLSKILIL